MDKELNLKKEKACGCIIIEDGKTLLVHDTNNNWGFPKGHVEAGETEIETAKREVKEETNIDVVIDPNKRFVDEYITDKGVAKKVVFFLAQKIGGEEQMQEEEVKTMGWFPLEEAFNVITYENTKEILRKALTTLSI